MRLTLVWSSRCLLITHIRWWKCQQKIEIQIQIWEMIIFWLFRRRKNFESLTILNKSLSLLKVQISQRLVTIRPWSLTIIIISFQLTTRQQFINQAAKLMKEETLLFVLLMETLAVDSNETMILQKHYFANPIHSNLNQLKVKKQAMIWVGHSKKSPQGRC